MTEQLDQIDAYAVADRLGIRRQGKRWYCPACQCNRGKSADVSLDLAGRWSCFKCGRHGNVFSLVMIALGCDFVGARQWLQDQSIELRQGQDKGRHTNVCHAATSSEIRPLSPTERSAILGRFVGACPAVEAGTSAARWLNRRGLSVAVADMAGLRWLPCGLYRAIFRRLALDYGVERLVACGLAGVADDGSRTWPVGTGYRRRGLDALLLPYHDTPRQVVGVKLRPLLFEQRDDVARFLNIGECRVYNLGDLGLPVEADEALFICEGETDTLTVRQTGLRAIGIPSANAVGNLEPFMLAFEGLTVYDCLDNDGAGERGSAVLADLFARNGLPAPVRVVLPSGCKDVNELSRAA